MTVIVNGDTGFTPLAIVPHPSADAFSGFFISQGRRWCRGVQVVVSDGSKSYRSAIDTHLGHARHVLDSPIPKLRAIAPGLTNGFPSGGWPRRASSRSFGWVSGAYCKAPQSTVCYSGASVIRQNY